ncbi:MAG: ABC1 kinase family protein [Gemmataceae bacterium]
MISLEFKNIARYRELAWVLWKHKQRELVRTVGLDKLFHGREAELSVEEVQADHLTRDLERLGATFVKFGQLMSTRTDMLPPEYIQALSRLQDAVEPLPINVIQDVIESELGEPADKLYANFEWQPLASGSIGQVHRATLKTGAPVVVKVQRPGLHAQIRTDLRFLHEVADLVDRHTALGHKYRFSVMVNALQRLLLKETSYTSEAQNARRLRKNLRRFKLIQVPKPILPMTTDRVLTMEHVEGQKITTLTESDLGRCDRTGLARVLFRCYLKQTLIDGFFHADPHPGNILLMPDNRLAILDCGSIVRIPNNVQRELVKLVLSLNEKRGLEVAMVCETLGHIEQDYDTHQFRATVAQLVEDNADQSFGQMQLGRMLFELQAIAGDNNLVLPSELISLGKTLLNLDQLVIKLAPEFVPHHEMKKYARKIMLHQMHSLVSPERAFRTFLESSELAEALPHRLNRITELIATNQLSVKFQLAEQRKLISGMEKIGSRIGIGVVLAALIVGASLVLHLQGDMYKWVAFLFYVAASLGGISMIVYSLFWDQWS